MDKTELCDHEPDAERPLPLLQKLPEYPLGPSICPPAVTTILPFWSYFLFKDLFYQLCMQEHG